MSRGMPVPPQPKSSKPAKRSQSSPAEVMVVGAVVALGGLLIAAIVAQANETAAYVVAAVGAWIGSLILLVGIIAKGVEIGLRTRG